MPRYRKKPVVIEAFQITQDTLASNTDWPEWLHAAYQKPQGHKGALWHCSRGLRCGTLEGAHDVSLNDYIIQGIKGEIYPCKPDIFALTYEAIEGEL